MVARQLIEPELEQYFHSDSYGYRPKKSVHNAVGQARKRCWRSDWVLDLDIKGFFDNIDHELMMRAVQKHVKKLGIIIVYRTIWDKMYFHFMKNDICFTYKFLSIYVYKLLTIVTYIDQCFIQPRLVSVHNLR